MDTTREIVYNVIVPEGTAQTKKPPGDADGGKEVAMKEYIGKEDNYDVEYDGKVYQFTSWSEMKQFIEENNIHG